MDEIINLRELSFLWETLKFIRNTFFRTEQL